MPSSWFSSSSSGSNTASSTQYTQSSLSAKLASTASAWNTRRKQQQRARDRDRSKVELGNRLEEAHDRLGQTKKSIAHHRKMHSDSSGILQSLHDIRRSEEQEIEHCMAQLRQIRVSEEGVVASPDARSDRRPQSEYHTGKPDFNIQAVHHRINDKVIQHTLQSAQDSYRQVIEHIDQSQQGYPALHADRVQLEASHTNFSKAATKLKKADSALGVRNKEKAAAHVRACAADLMTCAIRIDKQLKIAHKQLTRKSGQPVHEQVSRDDPQYEWAFLRGSKSNAMATHSASKQHPLGVIGTTPQPQYARSVSADSSISQQTYAHPANSSAMDFRSGKDAHLPNPGMLNFSRPRPTPTLQRKPPPLPARVNAPPGNGASVPSSHSGSHSYTHPENSSSSSSSYTRSVLSGSSASQGRDGRSTASAATSVSRVRDGDSAAKSQYSNSSWLAQRRG